MINSVILAGGRGSRLGKLTLAVNKHLLPVHNEPLILHVMRAISSAVAQKSPLLLITTPEAIGDFAKLSTISDEPINQFSSIFYAIQPYPHGIADALRYAEDFGNGGIFVLLGDNLFSKQCVANFREVIQSFDGRKGGAHIWVSEVHNPQQYGVLELFEDTPVSIDEKPTNPKSNLAVVGAYLFDSSVWSKLRGLQKSDRGEYEITHVLQKYITDGQLYHHHLLGGWYDIGQSAEQYNNLSLMRPT